MTYVTPDGTVYGGSTQFTPDEMQRAIGDRPVTDIFTLDEIIFMLDNGRAVLEDLTKEAKTGDNGRKFMTPEEKIEVRDNGRFYSPILKKPIQAFEDGSATAHHALSILGYIHSHYMCSKDQSKTNHATKAYSIMKKLKICQ